MYTCSTNNFVQNRLEIHKQTLMTEQSVKTNNQTYPVIKDSRTISLKREAKGLLAGFLLGLGVNILGGLSSIPFFKSLKFKNEHLPPEIMHQQAIEMANTIPKNNIPKIKILDASDKKKLETSLSLMIKDLTDFYLKQPSLHKLKDISLSYINRASSLIKILIGDIPLGKLGMKSAAEYGCYFPHMNKIYSSSHSSLLHEVGHAISRNKNFLTRIPLKLATFSSLILTPAAILIGLFHKKGTENPKDKNLYEETKDFIKNNPASTMGILSLPMLTEEFMASARAINFAEKSAVFTDVMKKEHKTLLKKAFGTYVISIAISAAMFKSAVFIKDKITEK